MSSGLVERLRHRRDVLEEAAELADLPGDTLLARIDELEHVLDMFNEEPDRESLYEKHKEELEELADEVEEDLDAPESADQEPAESERSDPGEVVEPPQMQDYPELFPELEQELPEPDAEPVEQPVPEPGPAEEDPYAEDEPEPEPNGSGGDAETSWTDDIRDALDSDEFKTVEDLMEAAGATRTSVYKAIERLDVEKRRDPEDGRRRQYRLASDAPRDNKDRDETDPEETEPKPDEEPSDGDDGYTWYEDLTPGVALQAEDVAVYRCGNCGTEYEDEDAAINHIREDGHRTTWDVKCKRDPTETAQFTHGDAR